MSVVVAIKENGRVYMGSDSQVTKGGTRITLKNPNNYKIWRVDGSDNAVMGHVGNVRDANIVRLMSSVVDEYDEYKNRVGYRFVVKYLVPEIIRSLKEASYIKDEAPVQLDSSFLFAHNDSLFQIHYDCSVIEVDDYVAIGSGSQEAIGSLLSTEGEEPIQRIIKAIKASAASDIYVDYPIILTDTKSKKFIVINEDNEDQYIAKSNKQGKNKKSSN